MGVGYNSGVLMHGFLFAAFLSLIFWMLEGGYWSWKVVIIKGG